MLRVGVPYGLLNSKQIRAFATIADTYDRGFGHDAPEYPVQLAGTGGCSGHPISRRSRYARNQRHCVRNITMTRSQGFQGWDCDPRPLAEMLRQYKEIHPEFLFLLRKFKYASPAQKPTGRLRHHDIGIQAVSQGDEVAWKVLVRRNWTDSRVGQVLSVETERVVGVVEAISGVTGGASGQNTKHESRFWLEKWGSMRSARLSTRSFPTWTCR